MQVVHEGLYPVPNPEVEEVKQTPFTAPRVTNQHYLL